MKKSASSLTQHASRFAHWAKSRLNSLCSGAFTMAEAIIVMTILGIIATIMITNLKMTEYRDRALQVQAKKVIEQIDQATQQIIINHTINGSLSQIYHATNNSVINVVDSITSMPIYYKKYMYAVRTATPIDMTFLQDVSYGGVKDLVPIKLKDGTCFVYGNTIGPRHTMYPGITGLNVNVTHGFIYLDVNCEDEPNKQGKDEFVIPLYEYGIKYD